MSKQIEGEILANKQLNESDYRLVLSLPELVDEIKSGQFLHVKCGPGLDPLLRRPISVHQYNQDRGEIVLLYRVFGKGTKQLAKREAGKKLDVMGPLGNGFDLTELENKILVVGGGIGFAPLMALVEKLVELNKEVMVLLGARRKEQLLCTDKLEKLSVGLKVATNDGSAGQKGYVTRLVEQELDKDKYEQVFACGPTPMLKAMQSLVNTKDIEIQVSLEERMGCGTGACLSCVCKVKVENDEGFEYRKACTDGPVFEASEVILDE
ncbi:dihydroorotate dehydrogenase electron transfer subunit [Sporohalobacter salinus]|uniref:dihydroorotate dehydrogenase electron transfer subunit n=1 Tax=Sporohalobacter salinus TaxID=1494606 RepID=UPI0019605F33|nr:dihydroorotate dehydrogenase electron transfer subunit [Sporohalobacter salinus]MBM7624280.1 dihydroorotate dehydrogenase electron transfer subunit [Sporohalobacter salinus]